MRRFLSYIYRLPRLVFIGLVRGYQLVISPHLPPTCRYQPTCSTYAIQAFEKYGAVKGLILSLHRIGRCAPWGGHGYDPPRWFGEPVEEASAGAVDENSADDPERQNAAPEHATSATATDSHSSRPA